MITSDLLSTLHPGIHATTVTSAVWFDLNVHDRVSDGVEIPVIIAVTRPIVAAPFDSIVRELFK